MALRRPATALSLEPSDVVDQQAFVARRNAQQKQQEQQQQSTAGAPTDANNQTSGASRSSNRQAETRNGQAAGAGAGQTTALDALIEAETRARQQQERTSQRDRIGA
ncbi:hypothetical protein ACM66B_006077 [Microbotryomycetes sp. NB124-2]